MSLRVGSVCGVPCRLFRVSFTGELGYELECGLDYGQPVWEAVIERGQAFGITPYGTEAMHVVVSLHTAPCCESRPLSDVVEGGCRRLGWR